MEKIFFAANIQRGKQNIISNWRHSIKSSTSSHLWISLEIFIFVLISVSMTCLLLTLFLEFFWFQRLERILKSAHNELRNLDSLISGLTGQSEGSDKTRKQKMTSTIYMYTLSILESMGNKIESRMGQNSDTMYPLFFSRSLHPSHPSYHLRYISSLRMRFR